MKKAPLLYLLALGALVGQTPNPTSRQQTPVDPNTGRVLVASADGGGVQVINP